MVENYRFIDKSFDSKDITQYHLSLQVFLKGFSFCILDRERNKFIAIGHHYFERIISYRSLMDEVEQIISSDEILNLNYAHVKLIFSTPKSTFVPSSFYSIDKVEEFFSFNHKKSQFESLEVNYIYGNSTYLIYAIPQFIKEGFESRYPNLKIYHQSIPFIEELLLKNKLGGQNQGIYLNIYPDFYDLVYLEKGNLTLYNSFSYTNKSDFQYYLLNTIDQLKLSPLEVPVFITGLIPKNDPITESIKQFVKQVDYLNYPSHFEYSFGFNQLPQHYFTNMLNLYQCG